MTRSQGCVWYLPNHSTLHCASFFCKYSLNRNAIKEPSLEKILLLHAPLVYQHDLEETGAVLFELIMSDFKIQQLGISKAKCKLAHQRQLITTFPSLQEVG
jgi:hypothetical protein